MFHVLCGYLFRMASNGIDSFDPFNIFELIDFLLTPALFYHLRVPRRLAWLLPWREMRCFESIVRRSCGRSQSYGAQDYRARSTTWSGAVQSLQLLSIPFGPF